MYRRSFSALLVVVLLTPGLALAQTKVKSGFNLFSAEQDVEVGRQSAAAAEQQLPILRDAVVQNYVNRIGQNLARNAGGPNFQYQFRVVNSSDINAFALPGGFIYVNRGVLDNARNEGEVAGVLAHEISHVSLRHGTHQASKAYAAQAGLSILGGLLGGHVGEGAANIINAVGGFGLNVVFLKYSRDLETQADIRGSQILAASGYSPADMVNFFKTLERVDTSKKTNFLADHPAPPDRIARIEREAQMLHVTGTPATNVAELRQVQSRLGGYGATNPQIARTSPQSSGRTRPAMTSNAREITVPAPSSSLREYTNRAGLYRLSVPSNWQVYEQGTAGAMLAPPNGVLDVNGHNEIVYGAIVNHYEPFNGATGFISQANATSDLLNQIVSDSPHLRVVSRSGGVTTLRGTNPNTGIAERVTVATRQLADEHLIYMLFVTPDRDASKYQSTLNSMLRSIEVNTGARH
jgi:Zn-dependent protease with chaperone function